MKLHGETVQSGGLGSGHSLEGSKTFLDREKTLTEGSLIMIKSGCNVVKKR